MATSPQGSPPSPPISSPPPSAVDKSTPPPFSTSPPPKLHSAPPKSPPPPEESNSPSSSTSSSSPPPTPPSSPSTSPPTPPSSSPSPPTPPSSSTSTSTTTPTPKPPSSSSTKSSTPPSPKPLSNNNGSNQNNATTTNYTPAPQSSPSPPQSSSSPQSPPPPTNLTFENGLPNPSSTPKLSPPPPNANSSITQIENTPKSLDMPFSSTLPIIISVPIAVGLLLILILMFLNIMRNKKKKKFDIHVQKGGAENGKGHQANDHVVINLPVNPSGNVGNVEQTQTPSPLEDTQALSSSGEITPNLQGQTLPPTYQSPLGLNKSYFTYEELAIATQGFSQKNLLGLGGFGFVHKGVLPDGKEVAVKSLKSGSGQGQREFRAEVEIISRVHHRHLVSLVGYSMAGDKKMLVYEFLPNKTLQFHLHGKDLPTMDWPTRLKIALGAAKGLSYLHEDCHPRIIHRDIKSANILLDFCFEAMVADFGLAKLTQDNNTHVSTRVMGTFGYLAPEYASSGKLSDKSDAFSFGVVLLELITGRRPLDPTSNMDESLVDWARPLCARAVEDGNFSQLVDPRLGNSFVHHEMASMVSCAAACIRHSARRRPKMRQIVRALEDGVPLDDLSETVKPDQSSSSHSKSDDTSNDYESSSYNADINKFRKSALESQECESNNYGNTSQCHLNPSSFSSD